MNKYFTFLLMYSLIFFLSCATSYKYTSSFDKNKIIYNSGEKIIGYNELNIFPPKEFTAAEYFIIENKENTNYYMVFYIASKSKLNTSSQTSKLYIKTDNEKITELKSQKYTSSFETGRFKKYNVHGYYFQIDKKLIEDIFVSENILLKLEEKYYTTETKFTSGDYIFFTDFFDENIKKKYKYTKSGIIINFD